MQLHFTIEITVTYVIYDTRLAIRSNVFSVRGSSLGESFIHFFAVTMSIRLLK